MLDSPQLIIPLILLLWHWTDPLLARCHPHGPNFGFRVNCVYNYNKTLQRHFFSDMFWLHHLLTAVTFPDRHGLYDAYMYIVYTIWSMTLVGDKTSIICSLAETTFSQWALLSEVWPADRVCCFIDCYRSEGHWLRLVDTALSDWVTEQVEAAQLVCFPGALPLKASLSIMWAQRFVLCKELCM